MKILVVSNMYPNDKKPFWGTFVKTCYEGYLDNGVDAELAVIRGSGVKEYLIFYWTVFYKLVTGSFDIAHVHYVSHSVPPVLIARIFRKFKIVLNFHGSDAFPESYESKSRFVLKRAVNKVAIRFSSLVVVPSEYFKNRLRSAYDVVKVFVSPSGGVDHQRFTYVKPENFSCMFAGRLIEGKGGLLAAKSMSLNSDCMSYGLIVGSGPEEIEIDRILTAENIVRKGLLSPDELASEMGKHSVFLFPSTRPGESLGLVVVEAIFSGMIPVVLKNGAVDEIIPQKYHDLLIADDKDDFFRKINIISGFCVSELQEISSDIFAVTLDKYSKWTTARKLTKEMELLFNE